MGGLVSTTANPSDTQEIDSSSSSTNPSDNQKIHTSSTSTNPSDISKLDMSSSVSETPAASNPDTETLENETSTNPSIASETLEEKSPECFNGDKKEEEDEEEAECGFCLFMKGGGCKESFIVWEKCMEDAEKNKEVVVDKSFEVTGLLKKCMEAHADYYEPILRAEKAAEDVVVKELEREAATDAASKDSDQNAMASIDKKDG